MKPRLRPPARALLAGIVLAGLAGCFNPFSPLVSSERQTSARAPLPTTPENAVRLFEWCWKNRAVAEYREVFSDDYRFAFATADSNGNQYRGDTWSREDELIMATNMFVGSPDRPAAKSITIDLAATLVPLPDTRLFMGGAGHKRIRTHVDLEIQIDHGDGTSPEQVSVAGNALFFLVRGDSAAIPQELIDKKIVADKNRWFIDRWEDETLQLSPMQVVRRAGDPARAAGGGPSASPRASAAAFEWWSMGALKRWFR